MRTSETGWPEDAAALSAALARARLPARLIERVSRSARRATMLAAIPVDPGNGPASGASRIGGLPDLPPGMAWPVRPAYADGEALAELLFQLGPDEPIGNMLPGALNILMREDDLAARRFDRAWAVYEQS